MSQISRAHLRARACGAVVFAAVVAALLAGWSGSAVAHPTLLYTTPVAETAQATAPDVVVLVFGEPVTVAANGLTVSDGSGHAVPLDPPASVKDGHAVTAHIPHTLPAGVYTVSWRVTGADGDLVEGRFRFAVGAPLDPRSNVDPEATGPSWATVVYRLALLAGLTLGAGGIVAAALVRRARAVNPSLPYVEGYTSVAALAGAAAALALTVSIASEVAGLDAMPVRIAIVQAVAFAVIVVSQAVRRAGVSVLALAVIAVAEAIRAHPNVAWPGWGAVLTFAHVAVAALWAGTLVHVVRIAVAWRSHPGAVRWLIASYARLALWLVLAVVATGCISALLLVPLSTLTTTMYGRLLIAKVCLVATAIVSAWLARRGLRRTPRQPNTVLKPARLEIGALAGVFALTATLTGTPPPADATAGQLPPLAAQGLVLPLATLAGQVGVVIEASQGRLVVRLATPSRDDYYTTTRTTQTFTLTGRLVSGGDSEPHDLPFTGCGPGCFLANTGWGNGDNLLTLHVSAHGWTGGIVSFIVPWPVTDAGNLLAQAIAAIGAQTKVTYTEAVTSDTSQPTPEPITLSLPAADWLALQPYSSGQAAQAVLVPTTTGLTRLALGYPAESRFVEITLDDQHRIVDEVQVDPKHVTRRHYLYNPSAGR
jgi:copper transport protein